MTLTWKQFRELTKDIPDDEEMWFEFDDEIGLTPYFLEVDLDQTLANFTNDNTIILKEHE